MLEILGDMAPLPPWLRLCFELADNLHRVHRRSS